MVFPSAQAPVVAPTYLVPEEQIFRQKIFLAGTFTALLLAFPHFSAKKPHSQTNVTRKRGKKIKFALSNANAREILAYFVVGANTKALGASA